MAHFRPRRNIGEDDGEKACMRNLPFELTPTQSQRVLDRWQRMSRLGFVPFVLLVGGGMFISISLFTLVNAWLALRAHHLSYPWSAEMYWQNIGFRSITLASACGISMIYWFSTKRIAIRWQDKSSKPSIDGPTR
jgi:hypothetical protein